MTQWDGEQTAYLCAFTLRWSWKEVLTFALFGLVASQGVAIETVLAAIAEKAVGVVDALEALATFAVAVPHSVGVDVVVAITRPAHLPVPVPVPVSVSEEPVVAQLTPFP